MAERYGDDDAPTDDDIAELSAVVEKAKAKSEGFAPKIDALKFELDRRREILNGAIEEADATMQPYKDALLDAADLQINLQPNSWPKRRPRSASH